MQELVDYSMEQWKRTPGLRISDAYKWLFHACMGAEHAIRDHEYARTWLEEEWAAQGDILENELAIEPLRPDETILRLHLRPLKQANVSIEKILQAFIQTAERYPPDKALLLNSWEELCRRIEKEPYLNLTYSGYKEFDAKIREAGFPAVHHSQDYVTNYKPAYRVVSKAIWDALS